MTDTLVTLHKIDGQNLGRVRFDPTSFDYVYPAQNLDSRAIGTIIVTGDAIFNVTESPASVRRLMQDAGVEVVRVQSDRGETDVNSSQIHKIKHTFWGALQLKKTAILAFGGHAAPLRIQESFGEISKRVGIAYQRRQLTMGPVRLSIEYT